MSLASFLRSLNSDSVKMDHVISELRQVHIELHHLRKDIHRIISTQETIMASNAELQASLEAINTRLDEASSEIVAKLAELRALIVASGPGTTPEIDALIASLTTKVDGLADVANADPPG